VKTLPEKDNKWQGGAAFKVGTWQRAVFDSIMSIMFSTIIRRVTPSLYWQARTRTAAAAHTQTATAASPSKLDEGEQAIYDKLSNRFQPSELLVQDVSGSPPS